LQAVFNWAHYYRFAPKLCDNKNYYHLGFFIRLMNPATQNLSSLKPGEIALIRNIEADNSLFHRLAALGFRTGKRIELVRCASFNGPLHVRIGSTDIILRRTEAKRIQVQIS
jgi:ferrous iron transport protein A